MAARPSSSRSKDKFRRRHQTLNKKAHQIATDCEANVYLVVLFRGQFHVYSSHEHHGWPPTQEQIDQSFPVAKKARVTDVNLPEAEVRVAPAVLRREATPPAVTDALSAGCEDAVLELREAQV
ncbi:hypothetical protein CBER1_09965 [Cercospora berteroae]|uniref:Uncharacterized protein n=1 Tax=Cercospora berteroae TaxID=357750 RepID=A0A2S6C5Z9_9PEZI|nr:hypothetical protein CBER1_09965 [Cercospora berteroae]